MCYFFNIVNQIHCVDSCIYVIAVYMSTRSFGIFQKSAIPASERHIAEYLVWQTTTCHQPSVCNGSPLCQVCSTKGCCSFTSYFIFNRSYNKTPNCNSTLVFKELCVKIYIVLMFLFLFNIIPERFKSTFLDVK